jgi:hypothetical protein
LPSQSRALQAGIILARSSIVDVGFSSSSGIGSPIVRIGRNGAIRLDYLLTSMRGISSIISKLDLKLSDYILKPPIVRIS